MSLKFDGSEDVSFKALEMLDNYLFSVESDIRDEIEQIGNAVHNAYLKSISDTFACYNGIR